MKRFCESHQIEPNYGVVDYCEFITNIAKNEKFKDNPRNPRTEYIKDWFNCIFIKLSPDRIWDQIKENK